MWDGATGVANDSTSSVIDLSIKSPIIYTYFGKCTWTGSDTPSILLQYSGDGLHFYTSNDTLPTPDSNGDFGVGIACGAAYVRAKMSGLGIGGEATVTLILNHSTP